MFESFIGRVCRTPC